MPMKSRVDLSILSFILTVIVMGVFLCGVVATYGSNKFIITCALVIIALTGSMIYAPISIRANDKVVEVVSPFKAHTIPMSRIVSVERFNPTMGAKRILGSGGFMGYWGIFREGDVGRYTAYYGKASDCFMLRLDNGDQYVLGCRRSDEMIEYIRSQIS